MEKGPIVPFTEEDKSHLKFQCTCGAKYGLLSILQSHIELYQGIPNKHEHKRKEAKTDG